MNKKKNKNKLLNLPDSCILEVIGESDYGDLVAEPVEKIYKTNKIYVIENRRIKPSLSIGDKFLGKIIHKNNSFWAKPIVRTFLKGAENEKIYGVVDKIKGRYLLKPTDKSIHKDYLITNPEKAKVGDYVECVSSGTKMSGVEIIQSLGEFNLGIVMTDVILSKYNIEQKFSQESLTQLNQLPEYDKKNRDDLTAIPFVTIDGEDSKDFDDAVYAKRTPSGYELMVAIADVAFYVRSHSALDRDAYKRGNSVYLPNIVVPMLPEKLSNDLCSLRPNEERAAIVCKLYIDNLGNTINYSFSRATIKSAARLTYKEVQNAIDGDFSENIMPVFKQIIQPLYEVYFALDKQKKERGALELESSEVKIKLDKNDRVIKIEKHENLTANKIIEECMIAANVAAAKTLNKHKSLAMFRVHEPPKPEKLTDIKPLLKELGCSLGDHAALTGHKLNKVLEVCSMKGYSAGINDLILRLQSQAVYSPKNLGHFGLALEDYVHFTSPIRRYSDLLIHRALISALNLPDGGGLEDETMQNFEDIATHISKTERNAISAEREMTSRYVSQYLEPSIGADFEVVISGVSTAGVFVRIADLGAEGLVPMRSLPCGNYDLNDAKTILSSDDGMAFAIGDNIKARLKEAMPITGGLIFKYVDDKEGVDYCDKSSNNRGRNKKFVKQKNIANKMAKKDTKPVKKDKNRKKRRKEKKK